MENLKYEVGKLLENAQRRYNKAAAQHAMSLVSQYGGEVEAYENVLRLINAERQLERDPIPLTSLADIL